MAEELNLLDSIDFTVEDDEDIIDPFESIDFTVGDENVPPIPSSAPTPILFSEDEVDEEQEKTQFPIIKTIKDLNRLTEEDIGKAMPLPKPYTGDGTYEEVEGDNSFEKNKKANLIYEVYKNNPDSVVAPDGVVSYKGTAILPPSDYLLSTLNPLSSSGPGTDLAGIGYLGLTRTAPKNLAEGVASLVDASVYYGTGKRYNPDLTSKAQNLPIAEVNVKDSVLESIINEGASIAVGMGGAVGVLNNLSKGLQKLPKVYSALKFAGSPTRFFGIEAGAALGTSSNAETLAIGDSSLLSQLAGEEFSPAILKGITAEPGSPEFEQVLAKRLNILFDGATLGVAMEGTVKGAVAALNLIHQLTTKKATDVATLTKRQEFVVDRVLDRLTRNLDTPEQISAARKDIVDLVEANKDVFVEVPIEQVSDVLVTVDTLAALSRALDTNDTEAAKTILLAAKDLKKGALTSTEFPKTTAASTKMAEETDRLLTESEAFYGGKPIDDGGVGEEFENVYITRKKLQQKAIDTATTEKILADNLERQLEVIELQISDLLKNSPTIFQQISNLEKSSGVLINEARELTENQIISRFAKAHEIMDAEKNAKFAAVKDGEVDTDTLFDILNELKPGQLSTVNDILPSNATVDLLLRKATPEPGDTVAQAKAKFNTWATSQQNPKLDFGYLYTELLPDLTKTINRLYGKQEGGAADILLKLKEYIKKDALDYVKATGSKETFDNAEEAARYYKEEFAPFWDDGGPLQKLGELRKETIKKNMRPEKFFVEARQAVLPNLSAERREFASLLINLLDRKEGGESASLVTDYIIGRMFSDLESKMDYGTGKLVDFDVSEIRRSLNEFGTILKKNFPEEFVKIENLNNQLASTQVNKKDLIEQSIVQRKTAEEAEEQILNGVLGKFFTKNFDSPKQSAYVVLQAIYKDRDNGPRVVRELLDLAKQDPTNGELIKKGMQSAYLKSLKNVSRIVTETNSGIRPLTQTFMRDIEEFRTNQWEVIGKELFVDDPRIIPTLRTMFEETGLIQKAASGRATVFDSGTAQQQEQQKALNRTIQATIGPLNTLATKIRAGGSAAIEMLNDPLGTRRIQDKILSDPNEFIRIARLYEEKQAKGLSKEQKAILIKFLVKASIYRPDSEGNLVTRVADSIDDFLK